MVNLRLKLQVYSRGAYAYGSQCHCSSAILKPKLYDESRILKAVMAVTLSLNVLIVPAILFLICTYVAVLTWPSFLGVPEL